MHGRAGVECVRGCVGAESFPRKVMSILIFASKPPKSGRKTEIGKFPMRITQRSWVDGKADLGILRKSGCAARCFRLRDLSSSVFLPDPAPAPAVEPPLVCCKPTCCHPERAEHSKRASVRRGCIKSRISTFL